MAHTKNNKGSRMMFGISWSLCLVISYMMKEIQKVSEDQLEVTGGFFYSMYLTRDRKTTIRSGKEPL